MKFDCPAWPPRRPEIEQSVSELMRSGQWGRYHSAIHDVLRNQIAETFGAESVRLTCSGTVAIEIALRAAGVGPGDGVIVAAFDYPGNFRSIELNGARPVLVDVDKTTFSISPDLRIASQDPSVKAVVASHLYGHFADMTELKSRCDDNGWVLIEDACQVPGLRAGSRIAGGVGDISTISFGGSKPLTCGSGGAVLVNQARLNARVNSLVDRPSDAFALSALQAAALSPQFETLSIDNQQRNRTAAAIAASRERLHTWQIHHVDQPDVDAAYYKLAFSAATSQHRARVVAKAEFYGLPIGVGFRSMHQCSEKRCRKPVDLSNAKQLGERIFVLDHRALMIEESRHGELIGALAALHDATIG